MARPGKNAEERRSRQIIFRLTGAEYEALCAAAARAGLPPNELARQLACKGQARLVVRTVQRCDPAFLKRIDRIGHNLNQLVKNAHIFGRVSPRIAPLCEIIDRLLDEALREDGHDS